MAIDPTIALKIQPAQPLDLTKLQQLRNLVMQEQATAQQIAASRASEALTRAQIPGVTAQAELTRAQLPGTVATSQRLEAEAELARQNQAANNTLIELVGSGKYTRKTKDATGNEVQSIDYPRLYGDLSTQFPQQALAFAETRAKTDYQEALARAQRATATKGEAEAKGALLGHANSVAQTWANIVDKSGLSPEEKAREFATGLEGIAKIFPESFKSTPYTTEDANGNIRLTRLVGATDVKKIAEGSMDPLTTARLAISQNELALAQLQADPRYRERLSVIPTSGERGAFLVRAEEDRKLKEKIDGGLKAKVDFAKYGRPGSITQAAWATLVTQDRQYALLQSAVEAYNAATGEALSIPKQGTDAVRAILEKNSAILDGRVKLNTGLATQPNIGAAAGVGTPATPAPGGVMRGIPGTPTPAAAPTPAPPTTGPRPAPKVGDVVGNYVYVGGDPNKKESWKKVK